MSKLANQIKKEGAVVRQRHSVDHPSVAFADKDGRLFRLPLTSIDTNPNQPRKFFDPVKLSELAASIRDKGVLQPILVCEEQTHEENGRYTIVAGERRYRAAKEAGLTEIPAIITSGDPEEIAIIENLQRDNLKPVEEAEGLARLMETHGYNQEKLAQMVGKAKSTVSEILSLNKLPTSVRDEVRSSELSKMILIEIAKQGSEEAMLSLYQKVKKGGLKGYAVRDITRNPKPRTARSPLKITLKKLNDFEKSFTSLDLEQLDNVEKKELWQEIGKLQKLITEFLSLE